MATNLYFSDIVQARSVLRSLIPSSPLIESALLGRSLFLKAESKLATGSFKVRGALNTIFAYTRDRRATHFVTASSGNQGISLAYAARKVGATATVVLPNGTSRKKIDLIERFGGSIVFHNDDVLESEYYARSLQQTGRCEFISCCDTPEMIAGYATIALEILDQCPNTSMIVAPVGGGGLVGGLAFACAHLAPHVRVIGVQSEHTPAMYNLLNHTSYVQKASICDALAGGIDGSALGAALCREFVDRIVLVDEAKIRDAIRWALHAHGLVIEGAAACAIAALMSDSAVWPIGSVALVLSGGNLDTTLLEQITGSHGDLDHKG